MSGIHVQMCQSFWRSGGSKKISSVIRQPGRKKTDHKKIQAQPLEHQHNSNNMAPVPQAKSRPQQPGLRCDDRLLSGRLYELRQVPGTDGRLKSCRVWVTCSIFSWPFVVFCFSRVFLFLLGVFFFFLSLSFFGLLDLLGVIVLCWCFYWANPSIGFVSTGIYNFR